jgi:hypothetical protein
MRILACFYVIFGLILLIKKSGATFEAYTCVEGSSLEDPSVDPLASNCIVKKKEEEEERKEEKK